MVPEIVGRARAWRTSVRKPAASREDRVRREAAASSRSAGWQASGTVILRMAEQPLHRPAAIHDRPRKSGKSLSAESQQEMRQALQQLMLHNVGIVRSNHSLIAAAKQLVLWRAQWRGRRNRPTAEWSARVPPQRKRLQAG